MDHMRWFTTDCTYMGAHHDVPRLRRSDGATHLEDHPGEDPVECSNGVLALVVGGDRNVHVLQRRVGVRKRDRRDVAQRRLLDGLHKETDHI